MCTRGLFRAFSQYKKFLAFVLRRGLCWFSLNYGRESNYDLFEIIRNENAGKRQRVHVRSLMTRLKNKRSMMSVQICTVLMLEQS